VPALALLVVFVVLLVLVLGSGGGSPRGSASSPSKDTGKTARSAAKAPGQGAPPLLAQRDPHDLPSAVSGEAVVAQQHGVLVIGGLDSSDVSTSSVLELSSATGRAAPVGSLSEPRHDTAAAELGGRVIVFAGGAASELDSVEALQRGAAGQPLGRLPTTRSDLSALTVAGHAYLLGGYDGQVPTGVALQTVDGRRFTTVATLPVAFRYAAVVAVGTKIYTFGGEPANGLDTDAIQELDTSTARARLIGHLPRPLSHASAVVLGGEVYIVGGRTRETPTDRIVSFDPATAKVTSAGRLPMPVTNAAATSVGDVGYLIGGLDAGGAWLASVIELRLGH
jgi:hypothetical protein